MRRILAGLLLLILIGVVTASAAGLDVRGGTLQRFHLEADIELPAEPCVPGSP